MQRLLLLGAILMRDMRSVAATGAPRRCRGIDSAL